MLTANETGDGGGGRRRLYLGLEEEGGVDGGLPVFLVVWPLELAPDVVLPRPRDALRTGGGKKKKMKEGEPPSLGGDTEREAFLRHPHPAAADGGIGGGDRGRPGRRRLNYEDGEAGRRGGEAERGGRAGDLAGVRQYAAL